MLSRFKMIPPFNLHTTFILFRHYRSISAFFPAHPHLRKGVLNIVMF